MSVSIAAELAARDALRGLALLFRAQHRRGYLDDEDFTAAMRALDIALSGVERKLTQSIDARRGG